LGQEKSFVVVPKSETGDLKGRSEGGARFHRRETARSNFALRGVRFWREADIGQSGVDGGS
jgi:hypothetical protein